MLSRIIEASSTVEQAEEVASGTYDVLWDLCLRVSLNVSMTITVGVIPLCRQLAFPCRHLQTLPEA